MTTFVIPSIFQAVDQMSPTVQRMRGNVIAFGNSAEAALSRTERVVRKLTPAIGHASKELLHMFGAAAIGAGIFKLGEKSVESMKSYEVAVDSFRVKVSGLNDLDFSAYQNEIDKVAKITQISGQNVATAFEKITGLNKDFAKTADGLGEVATAVIVLAEAGKMDFGSAAEGLIGVMNNFSLSTHDAERAINVLAAAQANGASNINQTSDALNVFGKIAHDANITLEQSAALIETMAKYSIYGADAGTKLTQSIMRLQKVGIGYKSGQFNINDALEQTNEILAKSKTAKQKDLIISEIFGIRQQTTARILLSSTDAIKKYTQSVTGTEAAEKAAHVRTTNLETAIERLGIRWDNIITGSNGARGGITQVADAVRWLTRNLEGIVNALVVGVKWFTVYKIGMLAARTALLAWNITLGISSALQGASSLAMKGNTTALAAQRIGLLLTKTSLMGAAAATETATVATWSLNAAWAANPVGIVVLAVTALAAGIGYLIYQENALTEEYERRLNLNIANSMDQESKTVDKLVSRYLALGMNIKEATKAAIEFEQNEINMQKIKVQAEIETIQNQVRDNQISIPLPGGGNSLVDLPGTDALREKLLAKKQIQTGLFSQSLALTNYGISKTQDEPLHEQPAFTNKDKFSRKEMAGLFTETKPGEDFTTQIKNELTVKIHNDSDSAVSVSNGKTKLADVQPKMTSTKVLDAR